MFLINWIFDVLKFLGLYNVKGKLLFLGLDNAGKTTLLGKLKNDKLSQYEPTKYPNIEELTMGHISFYAVDLGGHELARKLWKEYFTEDVKGVVFIVDAADKKRFKEAKIEIISLLKEDILRKVPILILGNKIDKKEAISEEQLKKELGINTTGKSDFEIEIRPVEIFMCSIINEKGYYNGFKWIGNQINNIIF